MIVDRKVLKSVGKVILLILSSIFYVLYVCSHMLAYDMTYASNDLS